MAGSRYEQSLLEDHLRTINLTTKSGGSVAMRARFRLIALLTLPLALVCTRQARTDVRPVSAKEDVARLPAAAAQLYADTTLFPQPTKWRDAIPWLLDLEEGIRVAQEEKRPILIWTSGDDPLERC
jgi:hypothetical protein